jgi:biotin carboxylase
MQAEAPGAQPAARRAPPRVGSLFAYDWDAEAFARLAAPGGLTFDQAGFDLFAFPSNAALAWYDVRRFATRQAARGRRRGWRAVLSHQEQFGVVAAALVAEQLGLPSASVESVLAIQHKMQMRRLMQQAAPEANLHAELLPCEYGAAIPDGLPYPRYVKPVRAGYSVLARLVRNRAELQAHTRFSWRELWVIERLVESFEVLRRERLPEAGPAHRMMLEEPIPSATPQFNLDGWVFDGQVHALGVVDAIMYPGTRAFMRWETPSRLPAAVQARALDVARRFLAVAGFRHGFFNMEFFFDAASGRLAVIEFNPRLASQFGDLYRRTLGVCPHAMSLALALGEDPRSVPREAPSAGVAASFVYRAFDPALPPPRAPGAAARAALAAALPDALLLSFAKSGHGLAREYKWLGSHRYGIVHLGGRDEAQLRARCERASALLGWPAPYATPPYGEPAPARVPALQTSGVN